MKSNTSILVSSTMAKENEASKIKEISNDAVVGTKANDGVRLSKIEDGQVLYFPKDLLEFGNEGEDTSTYDGSLKSFYHHLHKINLRKEKKN